MGTGQDKAVARTQGTPAAEEIAGKGGGDGGGRLHQVASGAVVSPVGPGVLPDVFQGSVGADGSSPMAVDGGSSSRRGPALLLSPVCSPAGPVPPASHWCRSASTGARCRGRR